MPVDDRKFVLVFEMPADHPGAGKHVAVVTSKDQATALKHVGFWHKDVKIHKLVPYTGPQQVEAEVAAVRAENPDQPKADDLYPDNPNKVLHDANLPTAAA